MKSGCPTVPSPALISGLLTVLALSTGGCRAGDAGDGIEVSFWAMGHEGEVAQEMVRDFERENPGIQVRVQQLPWTAAHEKLLTAYVGDATPDVTQLGNTWIPEFVALNALAPLDSFRAETGEPPTASYFAGIWATNQLDDRLYGLPWYVDTRVLFYRTDLLARAGYNRVPTTWAGWRAAMEAVVAHAGPNHYAIYLPTNEWAQPVVLGLQAGSPLLKDGGRYGAFAEPAFRGAFDFYLGLYRDGLAPRSGDNDIANVFQEFARGTFAMYITGPWNLGEFRKRLPAELQKSWSTAPLPGPDSAHPGVSIAGGASLALFRGSRHPREAWRLMTFLSRPEQQLRFFRLSGNLPARLEAWQDSSLAGDPQVQGFRQQLERVVALPQIPEWEEVTSRIIDHAEAAIRGGTPAAEALAALDRDVASILEKRRWILARSAVKH